MAGTGRTIKMVGFLQAQNRSIAPGFWRHPAAATGFFDPDRFTRPAVPESRRRGLCHRDHASATLRESLGLERPRHGAWRGAGG